MLGELCGAMLYSNYKLAFGEVWCVVRGLRVHAVDGWVRAGQVRVLLAGNCQCYLHGACAAPLPATCFRQYGVAES